MYLVQGAYQFGYIWLQQDSNNSPQSYEPENLTTTLYVLLFKVQVLMLELGGKLLDWKCCVYTTRINRLIEKVDDDNVLGSSDNCTS